MTATFTKKIKSDLSQCTLGVQCSVLEEFDIERKKA